uniref:hypothetical protein n=1 Tax=Eubacterium cellulosolvens TaxID=29322 RepID=UPI0004875261|nr:hypothetical protein [[Eubacterium] cellulosolvens]
MLSILIKKQLAEIFRAYLYNPKKNKARSKFSIFVMFTFFILVMVGLLGGMFSYLSWNLRPVIQLGLGWFYFSLLSGIAIFLGAFGSVFNTFSGLYLAKDNDLLLSMPIPVEYVIISRLVTVYLMGLMYSATVTIPAMVIYFITDGFGPLKLVGSILWILAVSVIVFALSCLLGYIVAFFSTKLKRKNITTVFISLVFITVYYIVYFKASDIMRDLLLNAQLYGEKVKGAAYPIYLFGAVGTGDGIAMAVYAVAVVLLIAVVWVVLSRSFLKIVTSTGKENHVTYREKNVKRRSSFGALFGKELGRFTGSASYMLNCGLGIIILPFIGVLFVLKGDMVQDVASFLFSGTPGAVTIAVITAICGCASMNDIATPSVSLEGKNLWILQSLPVSAGSILRAKISLQFLLTEIPALVPVICACAVFDLPVIEKVFIFVLPTIYIGLMSYFGMFLGLHNPNLKWTSEIYPIKQSLSVLFALFGGMLYAVAFFVGFILLDQKVDVMLYLGATTALTAVLLLLLVLWLHRAAEKLFVKLA